MTMKCPFCGGDMAEGVVTFSDCRRIKFQWTAPSVLPMPLEVFPADPDLLFDHRLLGPGWFCPGCGKVLCQMTPKAPKPNPLERLAQKLAQRPKMPPKPKREPPPPAAPREPWEPGGKGDKPDWEL